jgi:hypothetical protein
MVAGIKSAGLLAVATTVSATVLELPIIVDNTYSSVDFEIGTPPKAYRLFFDTGSSTSWVEGEGCTEDSCPNGSDYARHPYIANASSTAEDQQADGTITYLGGEVEGRAFQDIWSTPNSNLNWTGSFLAVNRSNWRFHPSDGLLGLGFSSIADPNTTPAVEYILWNGDLDAPRFSIYYGTNFGEGKQDGVMTIGGSHEDEYVEGGEDGMVYFPLRKEAPYQLWRGALRSINIMTSNNGSVDLHTGRYPTLAPAAIVGANKTFDLNGQGTAVFDTGAGTLSIPDSMADAAYEQLGWNITKLMSHEEVMECKHLNSSWAITFTLGEEDEADDVSFSIRGDEIYKPGDQCMPPFEPSGGEYFALLGTAFLKRYYSVFDYGATNMFDYKPRIGFGRLKKEKDYLYQ